MTATLRRLVESRVRKDVPGTRPLVNLDAVGSGTGRLIEDAVLPIAEGAQSIAAEPGDVLFSKLRPYLRKSLLVEKPVFASSEFLCLRPKKSDVDSRWLLYASLSDPWIEHSQASSYGTKMPRTSWDEMATLPISSPPLDAQRRIADFLDDQVSRIDEAVRLRREQAAALMVRAWAVFGETIASDQFPLVPLRRVLLSIADGPFGSAFTSADYVDDGPAAIRLGNIGFARFKAADLARVPHRIYDEFPRCHVAQGDLLIASLGDNNNHAGRACVAPASLGPAMVKGKCFVARPRPNAVSSTYLALVLSSPLGAETLAVHGRGSTRNMVNIDIMKSCAIPLPGLARQAAIVNATEDHMGAAEAAVAEMTAQVGLLEERKRSLITAAVTGEFDVTTASGRGV